MQRQCSSNFVQPGAAPPAAFSAHSARRSVGTLVVILAAITIAAVLAGICARICGGRHAAGGAGDRDIEGWVEKKCRSCLDSGVSSSSSPPPPPQGSKPGEAKK